MNKRTAGPPKRPARSRKVETVEINEDNVITLASGRQIIEDVEPPKRGGGPGRSRIPTEYDELIPGWNDGKWRGIPVSDKEEMDSVYDELRKAADLHNLGISREKLPDENLVKFRVHPKFNRGPKGPRKNKNKTDENGETAQEVVEEQE